jgi:hypothetical protein
MRTSHERGSGAKKGAIRLAVPSGGDARDGSWPVRGLRGFLASFLPLTGLTSAFDSLRGFRSACIAAFTTLGFVRFGRVCKPIKVNERRAGVHNTSRLRCSLSVFTSPSSNDASALQLVLAEAELEGFICQPPLQELRVVRAAEHAARSARPHRLRLHPSSACLDHGALVAHRELLWLAGETVAGLPLCR